MAVHSKLREIVAQENLRRAQTKEPRLTQRRIADESGVPQSVISSLVNDKSVRIDFKTMDRLCAYFQVQPGDLFEYIPKGVERKHDHS